MIIFSLDKILKYFGMIKSDWVDFNQFQWIIIIIWLILLIRFYSDVKRGLKKYIKNMKSSFDTIVDYFLLLQNRCTMLSEYLKQSSSRPKKSGEIKWSTKYLLFWGIFKKVYVYLNLYGKNSRNW